jgi:MFS family permease
LILASQSVAAVAGALLFGRLSHRLGRRWLMIPILLLLAGGQVAMSMTNGVLTAMTTCLLCGLGMGLTPSHMGHELLEAAPAEIRGRAGAALVSLRYLAQFLNPVVVGSAGAALGLRPALLLVGAALAVWLLALTPTVMRSREASGIA